MTAMRFRHFGFVAWAALVFGAAGCGAGGLSTVQGTVTLDGQPLPNATVTFLPASGKGQQARGVTDASGNFRLETFKPGDGAVPGEYKVIIQYTEGLSPEATTAPKEGQSMKDMWEKSQKALKEQQKKPPKYVIPAKYSDPGQTVLTQRVPAGGPVKFDLQSK
jgi:Carboxypeptidase regulatory-like domain